MKYKIKIVLAALAALFASLPAYSQFRLTETGMVNDRNRHLEYYVINCPGKGQEELFREVSYYLESTLGNRYSIFNAIEPDSFTATAFVPGVVVNGKSWSRNAYDLEFRLMVDIRDEYVRVWAPDIKAMTRLKRESVSGMITVGEPDSATSIVVRRPEEEMRVVMLFVSERYIPGKAGQYSFGGEVIFNRRGKLKNKYAKRSLEDYVNSLVNSLDGYINIAD